MRNNDCGGDGGGGRMYKFTYFTRLHQSNIAEMSFFICSKLRADPIADVNEASVVKSERPIFLFVRFSGHLV